MSREKTYHLELPAERWSLGELRSFCNGVLRPFRFDASFTRQLILAIYEAAANVVDHAYRGSEIEDRTFELEIQVSSEAIRVEIRDSGVHFDPLLDEHDHVPLYQRRGYGIPLIQRIVDEIEYRRTDQDQNILTLVKHVKPRQLA